MTAPAARVSPKGERPMTLQPLKKAAAAAGMALVAACSVGPDFVRPTVEIPPAFKEAAAKEQDGWKPGTPRETAERGAWWQVYDDPVLDGLERQVAVNNQNLKASEAAYRQAVAAIQAARASFFPSLSASPFLSRSQAGAQAAQTTYNLQATGSWEVDVWGRIRRQVESQVATAQASAADLASATLSAQAVLAGDYFQLRAEDELKRLLDAATAAYAQSLQITRNQYDTGVASRADVAQAETQLETTRAQAIAAGVARAQLEHAIAVLIGQPPAEFAIAAAPLARTVPVAPAGLPSTLLERRPDIAAAEQQVAAANAQIGVAVAAFYPDLSLSGSLDYASTTMSNLVTTANRVWSFGPQLSQILFDGGLRTAQVAEARAAWEQTTALYRQTVLTAFQQVEDDLAALRILEQQAAVEDRAVKSAQDAERLVLNQYKAGTVVYTSVIVAQTAALTNEQTALGILQSRLTTSVALIQALGGGWDASQMPADPRGDEFRTVAANAVPPAAEPRSWLGGMADQIRSSFPW